MKSASRNPNVRDLAIWHKTAIAATGLVLSLDKAAIVDKTAIEAGGLDA